MKRLLLSNTISITLVSFFLVVIGEGILKWGIYWPVLLLLAEDEKGYWIGFGLGLILSVMAGVGVGLPSLFIILGMIINNVFLGKRGVEIWVPVLAIIMNFAFDKFLKLEWSWLEMLVVFVFGMVVVNWGERVDSIRVRL